MPGELREMEQLKELERKRYYNECLIRSLESKLERIEPLSIDFEETMNALFQANDTIRDIGLQITQLNFEMVKRRERIE